MSAKKTAKTAKSGANPLGLAAALSNGEHMGRGMKGRPCGMKTILDQLPSDLEHQVRHAIDDPMVTAVSLAQVLTANGYDINHPAILRHRKRGDVGGCRCPK